MSLSRRRLLKLIALGVIGHELDIDRLLWVPNKKAIFVPTQAQIDFFNSDREFLFYAGIPYHHYDTTTREWLGFERINELRIDNETSKVSKQQS